MLSDLSVAHGPYFTRNVVITEDEGRTGLGEVPGGEKITATLREAGERFIGLPVAGFSSALRGVSEAFADRDADGRGEQTFDLRTTGHTATGLESALLDPHGQHLGVPGGGASRNGAAAFRGPDARVPVLRREPGLH